MAATAAVTSTQPAVGYPIHLQHCSCLLKVKTVEAKNKPVGCYCKILLLDNNILYKCQTTTDAVIYEG